MVTPDSLGTSALIRWVSEIQEKKEWHVLSVITRKFHQATVVDSTVDIVF